MIIVFLGFDHWITGSNGEFLTSTQLSIANRISSAHR